MATATPPTTVGTPQSSGSSSAGTTGISSHEAGSWRGLLVGLAVKGRAPLTGYERENFGRSWSYDAGVDGGRNGCDTRNDILRRDLDEVEIRPDTRDRLVETGVLTGPYSAERIDFVRGRQTSGKVQIDHVVALADARAKGAQQLNEQTRADFANNR